MSSKRTGDSCVYKIAYSLLCSLYISYIVCCIDICRYLNI